MSLPIAEKKSSPEYDDDIMREKTDEMIRLVADAVERKNHMPIYQFSDLGTLPYSRSLGIKRMGCHSGQRKLLLTEIEFLTCCAADSEFILYVGSAPCEKLPALLEMFVDKKFLLVDPNFHTFHAPDAKVQIVYQNVDRVSGKTVSNLRNDLKLANRAKQSTEDKKRLQNARLQVHPTMYRHAYTGDMSLVADPTHSGQMKEIQRMFETENYKSLVKDIISGDSRVYIIQDYMTEALCQLIRESIRIADTTFAHPTNLCFISDLRSNFFSSESPIDLDFIWNDALQLIFLKQLQPNFSMLKFHPPYMEYDVSLPLIKEMESGGTRHGMFPILAADFKTCKEIYGLDFLNVYKAQDHKHVYFRSSNIWLQAWAPTSSSEARLIISKEDINAPYQEYDARIWDDKFQYNRMMRGYAYYGAFYEQIKDMSGHIYDGCYDCAIEIIILLNYAFRNQIHSGTSTINVPHLIELLKTKNGKELLISLKDRINSIVIYSICAKSSFHGQLTRPLNGVVFYEHKYVPSGSWINQIRIKGNLVTRKKIVQYSSAGKTTDARVTPGTRFALADNVGEISKASQEKYIHASNF